MSSPRHGLLAALFILVTERIAEVIAANRFTKVATYRSNKSNWRFECFARVSSAGMATSAHGGLRMTTEAVHWPCEEQVNLTEPWTAPLPPDARGADDLNRW